jgi:DNA transformation protein
LPDSAGSFKDFVLDQLERIRNLRCRRMFGAYGLYCGEKFFGIIAQSRLYFKTDEKTRVAYVERQSNPFRPNPKQELRNYYEVPLEILEDSDQLIQWANAAMGIAAPARRGKSESRKKR